VGDRLLSLLNCTWHRGAGTENALGVGAKPGESIDPHAGPPEEPLVPDELPELAPEVLPSRPEVPPEVPEELPPLPE
jgi:hypothetical protein